MPVAWKEEAECPRCGRDNDVWMFEKDEPNMIKEHYPCESCGCEWTEYRSE